MDPVSPEPLQDEVRAVLAVAAALPRTALMRDVLRCWLRDPGRNQYAALVLAATLRAHVEAAAFLN